MIVTIRIMAAIAAMSVLISAQATQKASAQPKKRAGTSGSSGTTSGVAKLPAFTEAKLEARKAQLLWSLAIQFQKSEYPAKSSLEFRDDLAVEGAAANYPNLRPYWPRLAGLVAGLGIFDDSITYFVYGGESATFPFLIVNHEGSKCFVAYLASSSVYNTLRMPSAKQRAAQVMTTHVLPALRNLLRDFEDSDIGAFGVFVTYGSKDFGDESSTEPETLGVIAAKRDLRAYQRADISDDELLKRATVLLSDRHSTEFAKVSLHLQ